MLPWKSSRTEVYIESHSREENETVLLLRRTARSDRIYAVSRSWHDDTTRNERKPRVCERKVDLDILFISARVYRIVFTVWSGYSSSRSGHGILLFKAKMQRANLQRRLVQGTVCCCNYYPRWPAISRLVKICWSCFHLFWHIDLKGSCFWGILFQQCVHYSLFYNLSTYLFSFQCPDLDFSLTYIYSQWYLFYCNILFPSNQLQL